MGSGERKAELETDFLDTQTECGGRRGSPSLDTRPQPPGPPLAGPLGVF